MALTLRLVKGSALSFEELDNNFIYLSSSYVPTSITSSMTVLSSSYAITASYALNGGGGGTLNLQQVTDIGNTTTNDIDINSLGLYDLADNAYSNLSINDSRYSFKNSTNEEIFWAEKNAGLGIVNGTNNYSGLFSPNSLSSGRTYTLPNANGTLVLTVNGISATSNGNVASSLTAVTTGTSASLQVSSSGNLTGSITNGLVWIITNNTPDPTKNGVAYIYASGSIGQWYQLSGLDTATYDSRYLQLVGGTMQGSINMATYGISNAGLYEGTASWANNVKATSIVGEFSRIATGSVTASVLPGTTDTFTVVSGISRLLTVNGGTFSGSVTLSRLNFAYPTGSGQIRIGTQGTEGGSSNTVQGLVVIGQNAATNLNGNGTFGQAESLIAIGSSSGNTLTTGGRHSILLGRAAGQGIITGVGNTVISSGDAGNLPSDLRNAIIITAGGGYQFNRADVVLNTPIIGTSGFVLIGGGFQSPYPKDFYFGGGAFISSTAGDGPQNSHINFYSPSATGSSNMVGANFTINAGRGTGNGTPGDIYFKTATTGSSGDTLQSLTTRVAIKGNGSTEVTGSLTLTDVLVLPFQKPLPSSGKATGSIALSGSVDGFEGMYVYNGTSWINVKA